MIVIRSKTISYVQHQRVPLNGTFSSSVLFKPLFIVDTANTLFYFNCLSIDGETDDSLMCLLCSWSLQGGDLMDPQLWRSSTLLIQPSGVSWPIAVIITTMTSEHLPSHTVQPNARWTFISIFYHHFFQLSSHFCRIQLWKTSLAQTAGEILKAAHSFWINLHLWIPNRHFSKRAGQESARCSDSKMEVGVCWVLSLWSSKDDAAAGWQIQTLSNDSQAPYFDKTLWTITDRPRGAANKINHLLVT